MPRRHEDPHTRTRTGRTHPAVRPSTHAPPQGCARGGAHRWAGRQAALTHAAAAGGLHTGEGPSHTRGHQATHAHTRTRRRRRPAHPRIAREGRTHAHKHPAHAPPTSIHSPAPTSIHHTSTRPRSRQKTRSHRRANAARQELCIAGMCLWDCFADHVNETSKLQKHGLKILAYTVM